MNKRALVWLVTGVVVLLPLVTVGFVWLSRDGGDLGTPRRSGPPGMVELPGRPAMLWLVTKREARRYSFGERGGRTVYHFDLHGHDPATAERRWTRRLLTLNDGGHGATGRLLGIDRDVVWMFLHDQPVALSAADGAVLATGAQIAERNPGLAPMWPTGARSFVFDGALIVTTADALRWRIEPQTWRATSYQPDSDEAFRRAQFMSTDWNGGYRTGDFLTRHQKAHDGRWIGLYSEREAAEAASDGFGSHFKDPDGVTDEGAMARRTFWTAKIGKTREFSEGRHDRLVSLSPVAASAVYLQGGLMKIPRSREALNPGADGGAIVVHRSRNDDAGTLLLSRVSPTLQQRWSRPLPISELNNRWELAGRLLLIGSVQVNDDGARRHEELIVAVNLEDGGLKQWNVERQGAQ